ncbi:MAG: hypothetical protein KAI83_06855 [Thiomargarita sp.]|nr:hypothetical protein [Thiomargarita sp.]
MNILSVLRRLLLSSLFLCSFALVPVQVQAEELATPSCIEICIGWNGFGICIKWTCHADLAVLESFAAETQKDFVDFDWTTLAEIDNAGFNVICANENDEYEERIKLNEQLIYTEGNLSEETSYSYQEPISSFEKGVVHCCGLQDIDTNGNDFIHYDEVDCFIP